MSVPVLVEAVNGQYAATLVGTPNVTVVKPTRMEAIEALKTDLAQRVRYGELIFLDLNEKSGIAGLAGKYADDPTLTDIVEEASRLRNEDLAATEEDIYRVALTYTQTNIGANFEVVPASLSKKSYYWTLAIHCHYPDLESPLLAGHLKVSVATGQVQPLTSEEIWEIQARAETLAEHKRGNKPARGKDGLILPYQAKIKVNAYMGGYIAFFAGSDGQPILIPGDPPVWRVETALRLRDYGKVASLGTLDVNALTGEVIPLNDLDIQHRQKRAEDAALSAKLAAATGI